MEVTSEIDRETRGSGDMENIKWKITIKKIRVVIRVNSRAQPKAEKGVKWQI